jgi:hypothetical protein
MYDYRFNMFSLVNEGVKEFPAPRLSHSDQKRNKTVLSGSSSQWLAS